MRAKISIVLSIFTVFTLNSVNPVSQVDVFNYNFFGFKLSYDQKQIAGELSRQKKAHNIKIIPGKYNADKQYVNIVSSDGEYIFNLYDNKISSFSRSAFNKRILERLLKDIKNYTIISQGNDNQKEYRTGEIIILYVKPARDGEKDLLIIKNAEVEKQIWEAQNPEIKKDNGKEKIENKVVKKYFKAGVDNLRFRENPSLEGKLIRHLIKGEKLELLEQGKSEIINGVKGSWLKLKTEKNETGWAFDGYLDEIK